MKKILLIVVGLSLAVVGIWAGLSLWGSWRQCPEFYEAVGTFYYWFPGSEMKAGWGLWSGPDPLWCFKEDVWDRLPNDFGRRIYQGVPPAMRRMFDQRVIDEAMASVCFGGSSEAFTWNKMSVLSTNATLSATMVNVFFKALAAFECEQRHKSREDQMGRIATQYLRTKMDLDKQRLSRSTQEIASLKGQSLLAQFEREFHVLEQCDDRTNVWFKPMIWAEVPTNAVSPQRLRQREQFLREGKPYPFKPCRCSTEL